MDTLVQYADFGKLTIQCVAFSTDAQRMTLRLVAFLNWEYSSRQVVIPPPPRQAPVAALLPSRLLYDPCSNDPRLPPEN